MSRMNKGSADRVDPLRSRLEVLGASSAALYMELGQILSALLRELERGFAEPERIIASFSSQREGGSALVIRDATEVVVEAAALLGEIGPRDEEMLGAIGRTIERLVQLDGRLGAIREIALEMELISLNSMVTAIKAGYPGRALSYITDELKRLSTRTIEAAEAITTHGKNISERLGTLRKTLSETHASQELLHANLGEKLATSFKRYGEATLGIVGTLSEITRRAKGVREPLGRIMEEVQQQDIVKQAIDQVVITLARLGEVASDGGEGGERLDRLTFREHIARLSAAILEDVGARVGRNAIAFTREVGRIRDLLNRIEHDRLRFLESLKGDRAGGEPRGGEAWTETFQEAARALDEVSGSIERTKAAKRLLAQETDAVMLELGSLEESLDRFAQVTSQFYPIKVLSQLEVAKQRRLDEGGATIGQMASLSERINGEMAAALQMVRESMKRSGEEVRFGAGQRGVAEVETMAAKIATATERFLHLRDTMGASISTFSLYSSEFFGSLKSAEAAVAGVNRLQAEIASIRAEVDAFGREAEEERARELRERQVPSWTVQDERLRELMERFTVFAHKRTAATIGGFEIEQGGGEGELTIF